MCSNIFERVCIIKINLFPCSLHSLFSHSVRKQITSAVWSWLILQVGVYQVGLIKFMFDWEVVRCDYTWSISVQVILKMHVRIMALADKHIVFHNSDLNIITGCVGVNNSSVLVLCQWCYCYCRLYINCEHIDNKNMLY